MTDERPNVPWTARPPRPKFPHRTHRPARRRPSCSGQRRGLAGYLAFAGPAVIASIAYMDPGNFATNIQAGAKYGYSLLWVVLLANLIAMLFQALSAKLGIVTGRNLAEMCRDAVSQAGGRWHVGDQRNRRHGHRPRRIPRRRHRPGAAVQHAAARRHGGHRHRHLRHPDVRGPRLPPGRADHQQLRRHHRALLPDRDVHRAGRLGRRRLGIGDAAHRPTPAHCCSRSASSAPPSCRTRSICIPA